MFNNIFGIPVLVIPMPGHETIKEQFLPFLEDENAFAKSEQWDCNCDTTMLDEEKNGKFPWDLFFESVKVGKSLTLKEALGYSNTGDRKNLSRLYAGLSSSRDGGALGMATPGGSGGVRSSGGRGGRKT